MDVHVAARSPQRVYVHEGVEGERVPGAGADCA